MNFVMIIIYFINEKIGKHFLILIRENELF